MSSSESSSQDLSRASMSPEGIGRPAAVAAWVGAGVLLVLGCAVFWFDGPVSGALRAVGGDLGGDVRRELEAWQQFGQFGWIAATVLGVWLLDPAMRRRLLDYVAALVATGLIVYPMKQLVGRPRPPYDDPLILLGPWGAYPVERGGEWIGVFHAWETWEPISSDLHSMPSSHTAYAVALAVWLGIVYPRVRPLAAGLACLVGLCRVLFGAHWASDVLIGGGVALAMSTLAVRGYWGTRALDWVWKRLVDRGAEAALPGLMEVEAARRRG